MLTTRYLHLQRVKPYINKHPITFTTPRPIPDSDSDSDLYDPHPSTTRDSDTRRQSRFTLALSYAQPQTHAVDMTVAAAWHEFLNRTALQVLREWDDYVERIVYRHTIIPYVSVALRADGLRLVRKQEMEMREDEWKFV